MDKYIQTSFSRVGSLILAITTWVAIGPELNNNYGIAVMILVCLLTGLIEAYGYALRIKGSWKAAPISLGLGLTIVIASGTFSIWGADIIKGMVINTTRSTAENKYDDKIAELRTQEHQSKETYQKAFTEFERNKKKAIDTYNIKERVRAKARQQGLHYDLIKNYLKGVNVRWYDKNGFKDEHQKILTIQKEVDQELADLKASVYRGPKPIDNSQYIDDLMTSKGSVVSIGVMSAGSLRMILIILDIFLCLGEFLTQWKVTPQVRPSFVVASLERIEYEWQQLAESIQPGIPVNPVEDQAKDYERKIEALQQTISHQNEVIAKERSKNEATKTKQAEVHRVTEVTERKNIDNEDVRGEVATDTQGGKLVFRFRGKLYTRSTLRSNFRNNLNAYKKHKRDTDLQRGLMYFDLLRYYYELSGESLREADIDRVRPYLLKMA